jgi:hypothetical protein
VTGPADLAGRLALWWVHLYTRSAPPGERADRRAEILADLSDERAASRELRRSQADHARSVLSRVLRGVPADLSWRVGVELRHGRAEWHLSNPGTVLAALFTVLVPLGLLSDAGRGAVPALSGVAAVAAPVLFGLSAGAVGLGVVATARRLVHGPRRPRAVGLPTVRRVALSTMCVLWAVAGLWRFAPTPLTTVSTAAWAGFGIALLTYAGAVAAGLVRRVLDFGKVSS